MTRTWRRLVGTLLAGLIGLQALPHCTADAGEPAPLLPAIDDGTTVQPPGEAPVIGVGPAGDVGKTSATAEAAERAAPEGPRCGQPLVVSELMIDPAATDDGLGEYVELHNPGPEEVDLRGWSLTNGRRGKMLFAGEQPLAVPSGGFLVLAASLDSDDNGGLPAAAPLGGVGLANSGGLLHLRDPCGNTAVRVRYGVKAPWPKKRPGVAIELKRPDADPEDPTSWAPARARMKSGDRGSPGSGWGR